MNSEKAQQSQQKQGYYNRGPKKETVASGTPTQNDTGLDVSASEVVVDPMLNLQITNLRNAVKKNQQILLSPRAGPAPGEGGRISDPNAIVFVPHQGAAGGGLEEVKGSPFKQMSSNPMQASGALSSNKSNSGTASKQYLVRRGAPANQKQGQLNILSQSSQARLNLQAGASSSNRALGSQQRSRDATQPMNSQREHHQHQIKDGISEFEYHQPNMIGSQSARNATGQINNAYIQKRLPHGIQLVNYQEGEKILMSPQLELFKPESQGSSHKKYAQNVPIQHSGSNIPVQKLDATSQRISQVGKRAYQKTSIEIGSPIESSINQRTEISSSNPALQSDALRAVKENLKLIRKGHSGAVDDIHIPLTSRAQQQNKDLMGRRKQSQNKFQNQQHAIVHASTSQESMENRKATFLPPTQSSDVGSLGSSGGNNLQGVLSGSNSLKGNAKSYGNMVQKILTAGGINLPTAEQQEVKIEFPYPHSNGYVAQVHIKLEDQNKQADQANGGGGGLFSPPSSSNLIQKLKKHSQNKKNSRQMPQFQSQDLTTSKVPPLQPSGSSLQKIKRQAPRAQENSHLNNSGLMLPNPTAQLATSTSKLNLKQLLMSPEHKQVQSIEDVHFVRVYSNIRQREILNKSEMPEGKNVQKSQLAVRTKFDTNKAIIIDDTEKSLTIEN